MNFTTTQIVLVVATVIGAWGGFPSPPKRFQEIISNPLIQWSLVFVLAYQGGGGQDIQLSLIGTFILYVLYQLLN